jgi:hypothetical protein
MIIALAGRRVDATDATQRRFPLQNIRVVSERVRAMFKDHGATAVVCSAACGADLIALSEAGSLGLRRRVALPFDRTRFKETSVIDRPGQWGALYDEIIDQIEAAGDLMIVQRASDENPYSATNRKILDEALLLANRFHESVTAALVWDGITRGDDDLTEGFGVEARNRGLRVVEVSTDGLKRAVT